MDSTNETPSIAPHEPLLMAVDRAAFGLAGKRPAQGRVSGARLLAVAFLVHALFLGGCTQLGPGLMKAGRNDYDVAVQPTDDEQVLLNIVRMRYADNPL